MKKREINIERIAGALPYDQTDAHCERCQKLVEIGIVTLRKIFGADLEIPEQPYRLQCPRCGNYEAVLIR